MKTILFLFAVLIFGLASCNNATSDSVEINGVRWATRNVETPGRFARNLESAGGFFTWYEAQDACPRGWRLPTADELRSLLDAAGGKWTVRRGVNGHTFGIAPHQIFLPAAGARLGDGSLGVVGVVSLYWSSSLSTDVFSAGAGMPLSLWLSTGTGYITHDFGHTDSFSVRCVAE